MKKKLPKLKEFSTFDDSTPSKKKVDSSFTQQFAVVQGGQRISPEQINSKKNSAIEPSPELLSQLNVNMDSHLMNKTAD